MKRASRAAGDWRGDALVAFDAQLDGVWFRCKAHGLLEDCIPLGGTPYCPFDGCSEQLLVVSQPTAAASDWDKLAHRKSRKNGDGPDVRPRSPDSELRPPPPVNELRPAPLPDVDRDWLDQARRRLEQVLEGLGCEHPPAAAIDALEPLLREDLPRALGTLESLCAPTPEIDR